MEAERGSDRPSQGKAEGSEGKGPRGRDVRWGGGEEVVCNLASLVHPEVVFSLRFRDRRWGASCE